MTCPKCGTRAGYEAQPSCETCGQVFSEWKAGGVAVPTTVEVKAPAAAPAPTRSIHLETALLFGLLLSVAAFYFGRSKGGGAEERPSIELARDEAGGAVKDPCYLEGEVLDIHTLAPVVGARIAFDPRFAGVTGEDGRYKVRATAASQYSAEFVHADYLPVHIDGFARDWRFSSIEARKAAARGAAARAQEAGNPPAAGQYGCKSGETTTYNFALVPKAPPQ